MTSSARPALIAAICASVVIGAPLSAKADAAGAFFGAAAGSIVGNIITNGARERSRETVIVREKPQRVIVRERTVRQPAIDGYTRQVNRDVQTALNYFGFDAGYADGVLGRRSRAAIRGYQAYMGFPVSGRLATPEKDFLLTAHARAVAGGPRASQLIAQRGAQGALQAFWVERAAPAVVVQQPQPVVVQQQPVVVQQPQPVIVAQQPQGFAQQPQAQTHVVIHNNATTPAAEPAPVAQAPAPAPETQEVAAAAPFMPSFVDGPIETSMASFCNRVSMRTTTSGGMISAVSMTEAQPALAEQFCLARAYAMTEGEQLSAQVRGVSLADMQAQCAGFAPTMREHVAGMVARDPAASVSELQGFVIRTGMNPQQLAANARICLSIGYRTDNAEVALASALVLVGLGEAAFGEVLAHHMSQGFGAPQRLDRAADWYAHTLTALDAGARPVVAPEMAGRLDVIRAAVTHLRGQGAPAQAAPQPVGATGFGMPTAPAQPVAAAAIKG